MKYKVGGSILMVKLDDGEDFLERLHEALREAGVNSGVILSCAGMFRNSRIAFFKGEYAGRDFPEPMEIVSMEGNIALGEDGKIFPHIHVCLADESQKAHGGHLLGATVHNTAELAILILKDVKLLRRKTDSRVELQIE